MAAGVATGVAAAEAGAGEGGGAAKVAGWPGLPLLPFGRLSLLGVAGTACGTATGDVVRMRFFPPFVSVRKGSGVSPWVSNLG